MFNPRSAIPLRIRAVRVGGDSWPAETLGEDGQVVGIDMAVPIEVHVAALKDHAGCVHAGLEIAEVSLVYVASPLKRETLLLSEKLE